MRVNCQIDKEFLGWTILVNIAFITGSTLIYLKEKLFLEKIIISPDNDFVATYNNEDNFKKIKYTKNHFINLSGEDTLSKYEHLNIDDENYIVVEWESGDYVYGNVINCYYVLKKND